MNINHTPPNIIADVMQFLFTAQPEMVCGPMKRPTQETLKLAYFLINEEVNKELLPAIQEMIDGKWSQEKMAELLDHIIDSVYVEAWTAIALSLPFNAAWHEVQAANMSKFPIHESCGGHGCNHGFNYEKDIDGVIVTVQEECRGGRLLTKRLDNGKVAKPTGFRKPDIFSVLFEVWNNIHLDQHREILRVKRY